MFSLSEIVDAKSVSGSLHQDPVVPLLQDVCVRISASATSRATVWGSLVQDVGVKISSAGSCKTLAQDLRMRISGARSLCQDPVGALLQDHCMRILYEYEYLLCKISVRIPASGYCRTTVTCARSTCARSLCQDLCNRIPKDLFVQDLCMRISCPRSLCQDLCTKILQGHLCYYADLLRQTSVSGLCDRTACARSPCQDPCIRIL